MDLLVRIRREEGTRRFSGTVRISGGVIPATIILPFILTCTARNRPKHLHFLQRGQTIWKLAVRRAEDIWRAANDPKNRAFVPLMTCVFEAHLKLIGGEGVEYYHFSTFEQPSPELEAAVREAFRGR